MNAWSEPTAKSAYTYDPAEQPRVESPRPKLRTPKEIFEENEKKMAEESFGMPAREIPEFSSVVCPKCHFIDIELKFIHWASATFKCKTCQNIWIRARTKRQS